MDAVPENSVDSAGFCTLDWNRGEVRRAAAGCWPVGRSGGKERLLRVLVVDDDRDTADTMATLVRLWGHDAYCAYYGPTALRKAQHVRPDVVLLDVALPRMDGCQVARRLRLRTVTCDCLLIGVTGLPANAHRCQCYGAGIDLFLVKPVEPELIELLLLLERKRLRLSPLRVIPSQTVVKWGPAGSTASFNSRSLWES